MELDQLRQFVRLAELQNFTRSAEAVSLSQSALSRSIARLEEEMGQPLFERQTRKVVLTDAGRLLFDRVRQILVLLDDVKTEINDDGQSGRVRVSAIPTVAPYFLPERLRSFREAYPLAQLAVGEDTTEQLLKKVADGEVDVGIAALPIGAKHVRVETLFEEELYLVTDCDHPLVHKKNIVAADLAELPFVLLGEAHCLSENIISFCRQKSFQPVAVERTAQLSMVQELVALGHGISFVPAMARVRDASPNRIYLSLARPKPTRTLVMVSNPYRYHSHLVRHFMDHLKRNEL